MTNIYVLETSPKDASLSAELAQTFLSALQETDKSATVTTRRLRDTALLSLEEGDISALRTQDGATTAQQEQAIALSDELITELEAADMIVIAAPFHNFTMTALMRQWLDYVVRPGKSFGYSADGPQGLLQDKPVIILSTRGGITVQAHKTAYIRQISRQVISVIFLALWACALCLSLPPMAWIWDQRQEKLALLRQKLRLIML